MRAYSLCIYLFIGKGIPYLFIYLSEKVKTLRRIRMQSTEEKMRKHTWLPQ